MNKLTLHAFDDDYEDPRVKQMNSNQNQITYESSNNETTDNKSSDNESYYSSDWDYCSDSELEFYETKKQKNVCQSSADKLSENNLLIKTNAQKLDAHILEKPLNKTFKTSDSGIKKQKTHTIANTKHKDNQTTLQSKQTDEFQDESEPINDNLKNYEFDDSDYSCEEYLDTKHKSKRPIIQTKKIIVPQNGSKTQPNKVTVTQNKSGILTRVSATGTHSISTIIKTKISHKHNEQQCKASVKASKQNVKIRQMSKNTITNRSIVITTQEFIKKFNLKHEQLITERNKYDTITAIHNCNVKILNFKTANYQITNSTKNLPRTLCFDTSNNHVLIVHDKKLFDKYFLADFGKLNTFYFDSKFDKHCYYFIKITNIPNTFTDHIIQIKRMNRLFAEVLLGIGAHCIGNENIHGYKEHLQVPQAISYEAIQVFLSKMDRYHNTNNIIGVNTPDINDLHPSAFKITHYSNYSNSLVCANFRGMKCQLGSNNGHVCEEKYTGNYYFNDPKFLHRYIVSRPQEANRFCLSEVVTEYFRYFIDCDMNTATLNYFKQKYGDGYNYEIFWDYVINLLIKVLREYIEINQNMIEYLYCVKEGSPYKIHLHFPNIIMNAQYARAIRQQLINKIILNDIYSIKDYVGDIIDGKPYTTSLRLLNQKKCGEKAAYDINVKKSTYKNKYMFDYDKLTTKLRTYGLTDVENERYARIKFNFLYITSIATIDNKINFIMTVNEQGHNKLDCIFIDKRKCITKRNTNDKTKCDDDLICHEYLDTNNNVIVKEKTTIGDLVKKIDFSKDVNNIDADNKVTITMVTHGKSTFKITTSLLEKLLLNISVTHIKKYPFWIRLMFFLKNYGLRSIAHQLCSIFPDTYNKDEIDDIFDKHIECTKMGLVCECAVLTINYLLQCAEEDNPMGFINICNNEPGNLFIKLPNNEVNSDTFKKELDDYRLGSCVEKYEADYVKPLGDDKRITGIKSPMGTGKSVVCAKFCQKYLINGNRKIYTYGDAKYHSFCCCVSRQTLTYGIQCSFMKHGVKINHYTELKKGKMWGDDVKVSITPDSLIKTISYDENFPKDFSQYHYNTTFDIVCIDEFRSFLDYIATSPTLEGKVVPVLASVLHILRNAKRIIVMDAHMTAWEYNFLLMILSTKNYDESKLINDLNIVYNTKKTDKNHYYIRNNRDAMLCEMIKCLKQNKNVFVCTDSRKFAKSLQSLLKKKFPEIKIKLYTSENSTKDIKNIGNCNETFVEYDVVIISPVILYGCDFSETHFHRGFFFGYGIISPRSAHQQILRVRNYIDKIVNVYVPFVNMRNVTNQKTRDEYNKYKLKLQKYEGLVDNIQSRHTVIHDDDLYIINDSDNDNDTLYLIDDYECKINDDSDMIYHDCDVNYDDMDCINCENYDNDFEDIDEECSVLYNDYNLRTPDVYYDNVESDDYKYDIIHLHTLMMDHYITESNMSKKFYTYELHNYLTEFGGRVFYDPFVKVKNCEYKKIQKLFQKVSEETKIEYYNQLINLTQRINEYNDITEKIDKTETDLLIISSFVLMNVFNLRGLNHKFLNYIGDTYYIDIFKNSLLFSMNRASIDKYKNKVTKTKFDKLVNLFLEKTEMIRELLKIYFPQGLADNTIAIVSSESSQLTEEEINYWNKYGPLINKHFPNLCQKQYGKKSNITSKKKSNGMNPQKSLMKLSLMLKNYFGFEIIKMKPVLNKNISHCVRNNIYSVSECFFNSTVDFSNNDDFLNIVRMNDLTQYDTEKRVSKDIKITKNNSIKVKQLDKEFGKQDTYHFYKLDSLKYLELLLNCNANNLDDDLINKIKKNFDDHKCYFKDLHCKETFNDIISCYRIDSCFDYNENIIESPINKTSKFKLDSEKNEKVKRVYDLMLHCQILGDDEFENDEVYIKDANELQDGQE
jgi:hypothetical protein